MARHGLTGMLRLPDFSKRENRVAALLFLYHFIVMCAFSVIKPVRSALILDQLGLVGLLVGFMGTALLTGGVVMATGWAARRISTRYRVLLTTVILLSNLLIFWVLFEVFGDWVSLAFYIWASLFSNVLFTQFRLIAGNQFTPREGKKLFGWLSAGGNMGAVAGSGIVYVGIEALGFETVNLILASAVLLLACLPIVFYFERADTVSMASSGKAKESALAGFSLLREFKHVKLIALISGVSMVVCTVLDYQFNAIVDASIVSAEGKAAFFAQFFAGVNVVGLFFQIVMTRLILVRFGIGVALFFLPGALLLGSVGIYFYQVLWMAVVARLGEASTRYSVQEATREILYLPLSADVRSKARPLIDIFLSRLLEGLSGLLILVLTVWLGFSVEKLSVVSVVLISIWAIIVLSVRHAYVDTLRNLFSEMPVKADERAAEVLDSETVKMLVAGLRSPDEVQVCQNLALLDLMHDKTEILPHLRSAMEHPSVRVRAKVLELLGSAGDGGFVRAAENLLSADDGDVRIVAVRYLSRFGEARAQGRLRVLSEDGDLRVRVFAVGEMMESGAMDRDDALRSLQVLWDGRGSEAETAREEAARMLAKLNDPACDALMMRLLADRSPVVVRAAMEGAADTGRRFFVPLIVPHLGDERLMLFAQRALLSYGDRVLGSLCDYMNDGETDVGVRRAIPGCLTAIGTQKAGQMLLGLLTEHQDEWGDALIEALGELHRRKADLTLDTAPVDAAIAREILQGEDSQSLRRVMGLLALIYDPEDIHRAYAGLSSNQRALRSNALELLDNLLRPEHKRDLLPAIERWTSDT